MKITRMNITGQLSESGSKELAKRIGTSYLIGATAALLAALAGLVHAVRWW